MLYRIENISLNKTINTLILLRKTCFLNKNFVRLDLKFYFSTNDINIIFAKIMQQMNSRPTEKQEKKNQMSKIEITLSGSFFSSFIK